MKLKLFTLFIVLGLVLSACGGGTTEPASGGEGGGTAVLILPEEPATLNFYLADAAIVRQVADSTSMTGLVTIDETGNFVPVLATELPTLENGGLSDDYLTVTWKLREGLKWSDGEPLTSDDVRFTVEVLSNPDSGALVGTSGFSLITNVETPDDLTTVLTYSEPYPGYLDQFAYGLFPRHATGAPEEMTSWEWNRAPVTAGPFIVSNWASGESITLTRNPNYFEEGKPYLDSIVFAIVPDPVGGWYRIVARKAGASTLTFKALGLTQSLAVTAVVRVGHQQITPLWSLDAHAKAAAIAIGIAEQGLTAVHGARNVPTHQVPGEGGAAGGGGFTPAGKIWQSIAT